MRKKKQNYVLGKKNAYLGKTENSLENIIFSHSSIVEKKSSFYVLKKLKNKKRNNCQKVRKEKEKV